MTQIISAIRSSYCVFSVGLAAVFLIPFVAMPRTALAQIEWNNTTSSNAYYDIGTNWIGGSAPGPTDWALFNQAATYEVWWDAITVQNTPEVGFLHVWQGDVTFLNRDATPQHTMTINGSGGQGSYLDFNVFGANTSLSISGLHIHSLGGAEVSGGATLNVDGSHTAGSRLTVDGAIGFNVDGTLNVEAGGLVSNVWSVIGRNAGTTGAATVAGVGSNWNNSDTLYVGWDGNGSLNIEAGGQVSSLAGLLGESSGSGTATITGSGSAWYNSLVLSVGGSGNGTLNVESGGLVSNTGGLLGHIGGSTGSATVSGVGSHWNNSDTLHVGFFGNGTLNVESDGLVSNTLGAIGNGVGSTGTATVTGIGSLWNNSGILEVGVGGNGTLNVESGGQVANYDGFIGRGSGSTGTARVSGAGSHWNNSGFLSVGENGNGTLNVQSGGRVTNTLGSIGTTGVSAGAVTVTGAGSQWNNSDALYVGWEGNGTLNVEAGGLVSSQFGSIGVNSGMGMATVSGAGSIWENAQDLSVGNWGSGTLHVLNGGEVSNRFSATGHYAGSTGTAIVADPGSHWNNSDHLYVGIWGTGTLTIDQGGLVSNLDGIIGQHGGSAGTVTVRGADSTWSNERDLHIAIAGTGTLNIDGGLVGVNGTTTIGAGGSVNMTDGRFFFGETTLPEFSVINATGGLVQGNLRHSGFTDASTLTALQNTDADITGVRLINSGTLYGNASLEIVLVNMASGELETVAGERLRFGGYGNSNAGEINNFGGTVRFERHLINQADGFIAGRGQFVANGGWDNVGVMFFTGATDVLGDVENYNDGKIVTSGFAITTFHDDIIHNGIEIRTSAGGTTVFGGGVGGAGPFTGTGTVFFEGDLRPGNSAAIVDFEGGVVFGSLLNSQFEIGGTQMGEFDQLNIEGFLSLDGDLVVDLIDGFQLGFNQEFLIADVEGNLAGQFIGLGENSLVGNYGGMDLFISYAGGDGNDVTLYTVVPEPGTFGLLLIGIIASLLNRRRRSYA